MPRMWDHFELSAQREGKKEKAMWSVTPEREKTYTVILTYQISHHLARNIAPPNEDTPRAHSSAIFTTTVGHQAITALVRPRHHVSHRLRAFGQPIEQVDKIHLEELKQILVPAIANKRRLIAHRFKVNFLPRATHLSKLLGVSQDSGQCLRDLIHVEESHY